MEAADKDGWVFTVIPGENPTIHAIGNGLATCLVDGFEFDVGIDPAPGGKSKQLILQVLATDSQRGEQIFSNLIVAENQAIEIQLPGLNSTAIDLELTALGGIGEISLNPPTSAKKTIKVVNDCDLDVLGDPSGPCPSDSFLENDAVVLDSCLAQVNSSWDCPDSAIDGQMGHCLFSFSLTGLVPALISYSAMESTGECRFGGTSVNTHEGQGDILVLPKRLSPGGPLLDDPQIAIGGFVIDVLFEYAGIGACQQSGFYENLLAPLAGRYNFADVTSVLPDIATQPLILGHMGTVGGQTVIDRAIGTPPVVTEYTIVTPSERVLSMASATISHNDGLSHNDWGDFSIAPGADTSLLPDLLPPGFLEGLNLKELTNSRSLADDTSTHDWITLVTIEAGKEPVENDVCISGVYMDSGTSKSPSTQCIKVYGKRESEAFIRTLLTPELEAAVDVALERLPYVIVPVGPGVLAHIPAT